jgi:hypothetical protein
MVSDHRLAGRAVAQWQVNESLLQSYRGLAMTAQSFLLAVGAIVATARIGGPVPAMAFAVIAAAGLLHLWWIWVPVVRARALIVDYYKFQVEPDLGEDRLAELARRCPPDRFVAAARLRAEIRVAFFGQPPSGPGRLTRAKLDLIVPGLYTAVWLALIPIKLATALP